MFLNTMNNKCVELHDSYKNALNAIKLIKTHSKLATRPQKDCTNKLATNQSSQKQQSISFKIYSTKQQQLRLSCQLQTLITNNTSCVTMALACITHQNPDRVHWWPPAVLLDHSRHRIANAS